MRWQTAFDAKRCCSVSPTKLCPTLLVLRAWSYAQLLCCTLCTECHQHKSNVSKAAHKMMMKLTLGSISSTCLRAAFMHADPKAQKDSQVISKTKLTDLMCCCTSADLHFKLCTQVLWNWPYYSVENWPELILLPLLHLSWMCRSHRIQFRLSFQTSR